MKYVLSEKKLVQILTNPGKHFNCDVCHVMKEEGFCQGGKCEEAAIKWIKEHDAEKYNNEWIPCSERLPENNKVVLCWVRSTTIASGETFIIGSCDHGFWFLQTYEIGHHHFPVKDYEVVAWQPLPKPYQPKVMQCEFEEQECTEKCRYYNTCARNPYRYANPEEGAEHE